MSEVGPDNSELARSYDAYSAAATMVSSVSNGWGWEKVLTELVPVTVETTPRGRGISNPGTGALVEPRLETPYSLPARPACTACIDMFLTWGEPHTLGDVATDRVSGVRGQASEIAGNNGIFLYTFPASAAYRRNLLTNASSPSPACCLAVRNLSSAASITASVAYDSISHATAAWNFGTFIDVPFHMAITPSLAYPVRRYCKMIAATPSDT
jgi:hypothetical protein